MASQIIAGNKKVEPGQSPDSMWNESELTSTPVDFSFRKMKQLSEIEGGRPRTIRTLGRVVPRSPKGRYLSTALWLNNNNLKSIQHIVQVLENSFESPKSIQWLDFAFNNIERISEELATLSNLRIIYFHGNCIHDMAEVAKLKPLKKLRSLTLYGSPIETHPFYRAYVIFCLPQLKNLDFVTITPREAKAPAPPGALCFFKK